MIDSLEPDGGAAAAASPSAVDLQKPRRKKSPLADRARVDRLPPHSMEAEQGVLGCVLLSPNDCLGLCVEKFKSRAKAVITEDDAKRARKDFGPETIHTFYDLRHQVIYDVLVEMWDTKEPIDLITLQQKLKDKNQLEAVGGLAYLASLPDAVPSAANLDYYTDIVRDKYLLRRMIQTCTGVVSRMYEEEGQVDRLLDEVERDVLKLSEERVEATTLNMKDLVHAAIGKVEDYHQRQGLLTGLPTGFQDFDKMTSGLHPGEMIVIAARPSMGKTSLAMNIAEHAAVELSKPVGVFSLEMTADSLVLRMLCSRSRVNLRNIREGFMAERDFPRMTMAAGKLASAPLHIDDTSGLSILQLRAKARRMHQQHKVELFVIDYLQLLHSTSRRAENRQQEIADISNGIKALAKELKVPVIVLSQLNRELEKDKNRKPRLSDLRESGSIEQDADLVGLLYKAGGSEDEDGPPAEETDGVPVNLLIAKQRNGPTGDVPLTFLKGYTRYESRSKLSEEDVPSTV